MKKRVISLSLICALAITLFMPFSRVKADDIDLISLQSVISDVDLLVDSDKKIFYDSLGTAAGLSMRSVGYAPIQSSAIQEIGSWVWSKIHEIGEGTRAVSQWVVDTLTDRVQRLKPDTSPTSGGGGHRFYYKPEDTPLYNALYTDDEWQSLATQWAAATSHDDNFISFSDITDDVEGWADKYYDAQYPDGMGGSPAALVEGMTVQQRSSVISSKPGSVGFFTGVYGDTTRSFINRCLSVPLSCYKVVYEYQSQSGRWYPHFYTENGTELSSLYAGLTSTSFSRYWNSSVAADGTTPAHTLWHWVDGYSSTSVQWPGSNPSYITGTWNESTATNVIYSWYHQAINGTQTWRPFNIYFFYKVDGVEYPFSVHPGAHPDWEAPTQTPITYNDQRAYKYILSTINDYTLVNQEIVNTTNLDVIYNTISPQTTIYITYLDNPDYIEGPEPTPLPTTTPAPTGTAAPTSAPIEIPDQPWDVTVVNPSGSPIPVYIVEPSPTDDPDWGFDIEIPTDYPSIDIELPTFSKLTSDSQIQGTTLTKTLEQDIYGDSAITYSTVTAGLMEALPGNTMTILWIIFFIGLVVCFMMRR